MKTKISTLAVIFLLLLCNSTKSQETAGKNAVTHPETVTIACTPELYALALQWTREYGILKPNVKFSVIEIAESKLAGRTDENLEFVTNKSQSAISIEKEWRMVVGRDVIVPVINTGNPYLVELLKSGISQERFAQLLNNPDKQNWGSLFPNVQNAAIHIFIVSDESVQKGVARFINSPGIPSVGITIGSKEEVISAVQKDPLAIGFCNAVNVIGQNDQQFPENIKILPIDKNGNGSIDYMENIYADANTFLRGVWIGKYPKTLYSNVYAVSKSVPTNEAEVAFLSWVITEGQKYMNANGFCDLTSNESQTQFLTLNTSSVTIQPTEQSSNAGLILLIVAIIIAFGVIVSAGVKRYRKHAPPISNLSDLMNGFNENSVEVPKGIYFNKSHSWAFMEKDGNVSVGIDDFLQHVTGPITRVEMRNAGEKLKKGEFLVSIVQSGKRLTLYSPVSGIIKQQNEALIADTSIINTSPYSEGWVYRIEPSNWFVEVKFMDMAEKYKKWLNTEFSRMKDFLAATLKPDSIEFSHVVLQDGGTIKEGVLSDFGPEIWDDFQSNFLEIYK